VLLLRLEVYESLSATADPLCEGPHCPFNHTVQPNLHPFLATTPFLTPPLTRDPCVVREMNPVKMSARQSCQSSHKSVSNNDENIHDQVGSAVGLDSNTCHQLERVQLGKLDIAAGGLISASSLHECGGLRHESIIDGMRRDMGQSHVLVAASSGAVRGCE